MDLIAQYTESGGKHLSLSDFITKNKKAILTTEYEVDTASWKSLKAYWCSRFKNAMDAAAAAKVYRLCNIGLLSYTLTLFLLF